MKPKTLLLVEWNNDPAKLVAWANDNLGALVEHPSYLDYMYDEIVHFQVMQSTDEGYDLFVLYKIVYMLT